MTDLDLSFIQWWKMINITTEIIVHYSHEHHGLTDKTSNNAKVNTKEDF